ncbi:hypothetical protein KKB71_02055, partial [Patescibacteria group bacterium]|nr:hypothetical protein [Patescibacteria group bacterium]
SKGREMIEMALWGLLLAVSAWLLLNTINPDFVTGKFGIPPATIESKLPPLPTMGGEWVTKLADDTKTREYLKSYYIFVNKGPCPNSYNDTNCTMLSDLPQNAVDGVIKIKQDSKAAITITGGTEGGHKEHGPGKPVLDLRYNNDLLFYMRDKTGISGKMEYDTRYNSKDGSFSVIREKNIDGIEHFHVVFQ